jgi:hypothetical protein
MEDFLLADDFDLLINDGDIAVGDSSLQNQQLLLLTSPGEWKQSPTTGCGLENFLEDDSPVDMLREIREQFAADGCKIDILKSLGNGQLQIEANY